MKKQPKQRHAFRFSVGPEKKIITAWARVIWAKRDVFLPLKAEHVRESIALKGVGNTANCSMAVCSRRESQCFPHKVEGYIDWWYSRAFVVSRTDKHGMPSECYLYTHSDGIGRLNDSIGGQRKLLAELEMEGDRIIHLRPPRENEKSRARNRKPEGRKDGSRTKTMPRGAKLRFATAQAGAVAP